jgi:hypothetical protein
MVCTLSTPARGAPFKVHDGLQDELLAFAIKFCEAPTFDILFVLAVGETEVIEHPPVTFKFQEHSATS